MFSMLFIAGLCASAPSSRLRDLSLCHRAGGQHPSLDAATASYETPAACAERGCEYRDGACRYAGALGAEVPNITTVHLIQSNHLDVGYTDDAVNVINLYFDQYFPRAAQVGAELRARDGDERLRWMTQTYLVSLFLDCPTGLGLHCPNATAVATFEAAVRAGDIVWQAFPHNAELMMLDPALMQFGVRLTHELDDRFNLTRRTVLSTRDVPGFDRSIIPRLREVGITALSLGMNGRIFPQNVPPAFVWRDEGPIPDSLAIEGADPVTVTPPSGKDILALWHPRGYGELGDFVTIPGLSHALAYDWRGDNQGPPEDSGEVVEGFKAVRAVFPGATVVASTLDAFVAEIEAADGVRDSLPVITQEVGDSWIWGCAQDPVKHAQLRSMMRARTSNAAAANDADGRNFSRQVLKGSEHTWGIHVQSYGMYLNGPYTNSDFHKHRDPAKSGKYKYVSNFEQAWRGQRDLTVALPLQALPEGHAVKDAIDKDFVSDWTACTVCWLCEARVVQRPTADDWPDI